MNKHNIIRKISLVIYTIPWLINITIFFYFIMFPDFPHFDNDEIMTIMYLNMILCAVGSFVLYITFRSLIKLSDRLIFLMNIFVNLGAYSVFLIGGFGSATAFLILAIVVSVVFVSYSLKTAIKVLRI